MRETRLSGSVEGVVINHDSYSDSQHWSESINEAIWERIAAKSRLFRRAVRGRLSRVCMSLLFASKRFNDRCYPVPNHWKAKFVFLHCSRN